MLVKPRDPCLDCVKRVQDCKLPNLPYGSYEGIHKTRRQKLPALHLPWLRRGLSCQVHVRCLEPSEQLVICRDADLNQDKETYFLALSLRTSAFSFRFVLRP